MTARFRDLGFSWVMLALCSSAFWMWNPPATSFAQSAEPKSNMSLTVGIQQPGRAEEKMDEDGNPMNMCRNGFFPAYRFNFKLGIIAVAGKDRIHFYKDDGDCPRLDDPKCTERRYLIPGDVVILSKEFNRFICSWYQPKKGYEAVGWIPKGALTIMEPDPNPSLENWVGTWNSYDDSLVIEIDRGKKQLHVEGSAQWLGQAGVVHVGSIDASSIPNANELKLVEDEQGCKLTLRLISNFLIAHDNSGCGGLNVRFDGVYQRK
jgi:hypothetical protein